MSEEGLTDVVSATHLAISEPPSVASEECSTVAGTPIVRRCSAAGWSIYYQHLLLEEQGDGAHLETFHETLYTTYIIPYQLHQALILSQQLYTCWRIPPISP